MLPRVLQHIEFSNARAIIIGPQWPSQTWFPKLSELAVAWSQFALEPGDGSPFERFGSTGWETVQTTSFEAILVAVAAEGN